MYRGRKRQSAAGEEGRESHEMATFLSGSSHDQDAPGARPSAPAQDVRAGTYPSVPRDGARAAAQVGS